LAEAYYSTSFAEATSFIVVAATKLYMGKGLRRKCKALVGKDPMGEGGATIRIQVFAICISATKPSKSLAQRACAGDLPESG
jgi:hypothetical protein